MEKKGTIGRWGWWAVIGLAVILVVAGIVLVIGALQPEPTADVSSAEAVGTGLEEQGQNSGTIEAEDEMGNSQVESEELSEEDVIGDGSGSNSLMSENNDLPKTGPDNVLVYFILAGIAVYGVALWFCSRREKREVGIKVK